MNADGITDLESMSAAPVEITGLVNGRQWLIEPSGEKRLFWLHLSEWISAANAWKPCLPQHSKTDKRVGSNRKNTRPRRGYSCPTTTNQATIITVMESADSSVYSRHSQLRPLFTPWGADLQTESADSCRTRITQFSIHTL